MNSKIKNQKLTLRQNSGLMLSKVEASKSKNGGGYTLIEVLVAITIFVIIIAGPTGFLTTSLKGQKKALATMEIVDSTSFSLEYISRTLRMAKKDQTGDCIEAGANYENPDGDVSKIRFLNYQELCQEFSLMNGQLGQRQSIDKSKTNLSQFLPQTPEDLEITLLKFELTGRTQSDDFQPRATILFELQKKNQPESKIRLQTSISQRNLDVNY
jgi:prepilin-type N-terminal cleavage/methylation domain-containing protein